MGKSKKPHQNISKGFDQTGDWRLPIQTTKLSGREGEALLEVFMFVVQRDMQVFVSVQSLVIATPCTRKQVAYCC